MAIILISGANRGIGLRLSQRFAARGDRVIALCRTSSPELAASGAQVEAGIDVTDGPALEALSARLGEVRLDVLVCNAGIFLDDGADPIEETGYESMRQQFDVNALGPLRLVQSMRGRLGAGSKVGIVTSRMGSVADNGSGGHYGYRASKAAVNAIGKSLSVDLRPAGVAVFLLHPGYVSTDMTGHRGDTSPEQSATNLIQRLDSLTLAQTGTFWHANGAPLHW